MKPSISTAALVITLAGTATLVFNAVGLSISVEAFTDPAWSGPVQRVSEHASLVHAWSLDLWSLSQRVWMTIGCVLIVCGRLFDARFPRR